MIQFKPDIHVDPAETKECAGCGLTLVARDYAHDNGMVYRVNWDRKSVCSSNACRARRRNQIHGLPHEATGAREKLATHHATRTRVTEECRSLRSIHDNQRRIRRREALRMEKELREKRLLMWKEAEFDIRRRYPPRYLRKDGYVQTSIPLDHPFIEMAKISGKWGYILEHRLVAAQKVGRVLLPGEEVHHVNADKSDNRPENLQVLTAEEHAALHWGPDSPTLERWAAATVAGVSRRAGRVAA